MPPSQHVSVSFFPVRTSNTKICAATPTQIIEVEGVETDARAVMSPIEPMLSGASLACCVIVDFFLFVL